MGLGEGEVEDVGNGSQENKKRHLQVLQVGRIAWDVGASLKGTPISEPSIWMRVLVGVWWERGVWRGLKTPLLLTTWVFEDLGRLNVGIRLSNLNQTQQNWGQCWFDPYRKVQVSSIMVCQRRLKFTASMKCLPWRTDFSRKSFRTMFAMQLMSIFPLP